jgi:hypothetical protein
LVIYKAIVGIREEGTQVGRCISISVKFRQPIAEESL